MKNIDLGYKIHVTRRKFGTKGQEMIGGLGKLHNENIRQKY
jgi:hypothetical protein